MTKAEKTAVIDELKNKFAESDFFYLTDCSTLTVAEVNDLRRECFSKGIKLRVAKNTLIRKALEQVSAENEQDYTAFLEALKGPSALMFTEVGNAPAKIIKKFREDHERPLLKAAYIETDIIVGDENLEALSKLKSKEDLLGEIVSLLQSPLRNVVGALQSGGHKISGLLKALEERGAAE